MTSQALPAAPAGGSVTGGQADAPTDPPGMRRIAVRRAPAERGERFVAGDLRT